MQPYCENHYETKCSKTDTIACKKPCGTLLDCGQTETCIDNRDKTKQTFKEKRKHARHHRCNAEGYQQNEWNVLMAAHPLEEQDYTPSTDDTLTRDRQLSPFTKSTRARSTVKQGNTSG